MHNYFVYIALSYTAFAVIIIYYPWRLWREHRRTLTQVKLEQQHVDTA